MRDRDETAAPALALRSWLRLATEAAKGYGVEFGDNADHGLRMFSMATRGMAAETLAEHYASELDGD